MRNPSNLIAHYTVAIGSTVLAVASFLIFLLLLRGFYVYKLSSHRSSESNARLKAAKLPTRIQLFSALSVLCFYLTILCSSILSILAIINNKVESLPVDHLNSKSITIISITQYGCVGFSYALLYLLQIARLHYTFHNSYYAYSGKTVVLLVVILAICGAFLITIVVLMLAGVMRYQMYFYFFCGMAWFITEAFASMLLILFVYKLFQLTKSRHDSVTVETIFTPVNNTLPPLRETTITSQDYNYISKTSEDISFGGSNRNEVLPQPPSPQHRISRLDSLSSDCDESCTGDYSVTTPQFSISHRIRLSERQMDLIQAMTRYTMLVTLHCATTFVCLSAGLFVFLFWTRSESFSNSDIDGVFFWAVELLFAINAFCQLVFVCLTFQFLRFWYNVCCSLGHNWCTRLCVWFVKRQYEKKLQFRTDIDPTQFLE